MNNNISSIHPFLRWAGSKKALKEEIIKYFPSSFESYHEPFLGAGSIFFSINKKNKCHLSDLNEELINTYIQIQNNVEDVINILETYENNSNFYYYIRTKKTSSNIEAAARFIYLNRTCYNGLFRVNSSGQFNVPYGKRNNVDFITKDLLFLISQHLKNITINCCDFYTTLPFIKKNDLVFLDPPYVVSHNNNGFIEYNQKIFSWDDQIRLHEFIKKIIEKEAHFILTNAAHLSIKDLYSDICTPITLKRNSCIGGKNSYRGNIEEYLFTNSLPKY